MACQVESLIVYYYDVEKDVFEYRDMETAQKHVHRILLRRLLGVRPPVVTPCADLGRS